MGLPEEISNIEHFPIYRRMAAGAHHHADEADVQPEAAAKRTLTPVAKGDVQFWHQGEVAGEKVTGKSAPAPKKGVNPARRADQLGLLLACIALAVLISLVLLLRLTGNSPTFKQEEKKAITPVMDFYQGNNAFSKKVKEEKDAKAGILQGDGGMIRGANVDLEISLKDQVDSMNEKLEKMRSQRLLEESPIAPEEKEAARLPAQAVGVRPTDPKNFSAPLEFNGMLPKTLQSTQ